MLPIWGKELEKLAVTVSWRSRKNPRGAAGTGQEQSPPPHRDGLGRAVGICVEFKEKCSARPGGIGL